MRRCVISSRFFSNSLSVELRLHEKVFQVKQRLISAITVSAVVTLVTAACTTHSQGGPDASTGPSKKLDAEAVRTDRALSARVPVNIKNRGVLIVGSDTSYPPAEFLGGADGQTPAGFDVDLARDIARTLGLRLDWQTAKFDSILPAIGHKYDIGISAFSITNERYGAVDFVSYMRAGRIWAVRSGNPDHFDPDNPCGVSVGVQVGSTAQKAVAALDKKCRAAGKRGIDIQAFDKQSDIVTRLLNGTLEATHSGLTTLGYAVKNTQGKLETIGSLGSVEPNGIAIAKGDAKWAALIADAVNKLIGSGDYGRILAAWHVKEAAINKARVNPTVHG